LESGAVALTRGAGAVIIDRPADDLSPYGGTRGRLVAAYRPRAAATLAGLIVVLVLLARATTATAGTYTVVICPGDDGWTQDPPSALFVPFADGCTGTGTAGLSLALGPNPDSGYTTETGGAITFATPAGMSISSYNMNLSAYGGPCTIASNQCVTGFGSVEVDHTGQSDPDYDYRNLGYGNQTVNLSPGPLPTGVNWVTVSVGCDGGPGGYSCPGSQGTSPEAQADILSADFAIASHATPSANGFAGSLLAPSAHGTANITFTAADPGGPGVYEITATIDGNVVYNATPDGNGGSCHALGTSSDGSWEFDQLLPCKQQVAADIPIDTTALTDGLHELAVAVMDAADNSSVVYDGTITTANRTTVSGLLSTPPANTPTTPVYAFSLARATRTLTRGISRRYNHSAITLSGTLETPAGVPASAVPVTLWAQPASGGPFTKLHQTATSGAGAWTLTAPRGSSRLLRVSAGSQATPASAENAISVREAVTPTLSLHVATPGHGTLVFSGRLAIAPLGTPRPVVFIETPGPSGWEAVGAPVRVGPHGGYRLAYRSSSVTLGRRFKFRAETPATERWRSAQSAVRSAVVR
jgi:hypothetical protein